MPRPTRHTAPCPAVVEPALTSRLPARSGSWQAKVLASVCVAATGMPFALAQAQSSTPAPTTTAAPKPEPKPKPRPWMACFDLAAAHHGVSAEVLRAIADQESSMRPGARNQNTDGTEDLGLMQINSLWFAELARRGVSVAQLLDPCTNIHAGAWILSKQIERFGNTWRAIGAYHSKTPEHNARYAWGVYRRLSRTTATETKPAGWASFNPKPHSTEAEPSYPLE